MRTKPKFFIISALLFFSECNGDNGNDARDEFIDSRYFVFDTAINPSSLTQEDSFSIYSIVTEFAPAPESYLIEAKCECAPARILNAPSPIFWLSVLHLSTVPNPDFALIAATFAFI